MLQSVLDQFARVRAVSRRLFLQDGLARIVIFLVLFFLVTFAIDYLLDIPVGLRRIFLALGIVGIIWLVWDRIVYSLRRVISDDDLAVLVEQRYPHLNDRLISALQLSRQDPKLYGGFNSPELVSALIKDAAQVSKGLNFFGIITKREVSRLLVWALVLVIGGVGVGLYGGDLTDIYFRRLLGYARWPQKTFLTVYYTRGEATMAEPEPSTQQERCHPRCMVAKRDQPILVAKGDPLEIHVKVKGKVPSKVYLYSRYKGTEMSEKMVKIEHHVFAYSVECITNDFEFWAAGGDDQTEPYKVLTLNRPIIESVRHWYQYPEYTGLINTRQDRPEEGGNIKGPVGSRVKIHALANEEIESARVLKGKPGQEVPIELVKVIKDPNGLNRIVEVEFSILEASSEYRIHLLGKNGLSNKDPIRYTIQGTVDNKPEIRLIFPTRDEYTTDNAEWPMRVEIQDEFGIKNISLVYRVMGPTGKDVTIDFGRDQNSREYGSRRITSRYTLSIKDLKPRPFVGEAIEYYYLANDYNPFFFESSKSEPPKRFMIVSPVDLMDKLRAMITRARSELEKILDNQRRWHEVTLSCKEEYAGVAELSQEQRRKLRDLELNQSRISQHLWETRKDIDGVKLRGTINKVFDEELIDYLTLVLGHLDLLVSDPQEATRIGFSDSATAHIKLAQSTENPTLRVDCLGKASRDQKEVIKGLEKVLEILEVFGTYELVLALLTDVLGDQRYAVMAMKLLIAKRITLQDIRDGVITRQDVERMYKELTGKKEEE
jgi:hypothetical protein